MSSRTIIFGMLLSAFLIGCDAIRVHESNVELSDRIWLQDSLLHFDFEITQAKQKHNVLANIQYANDFGYRNLYMTYILYDSLGSELNKSLINVMLFSNKLGKPLGDSAIGDIYELQHPILSEYKFPNNGKYRVSLQQYMRIDSLNNLTSIGLRIEKSSPN